MNELEIEKRLTILEEKDKCILYVLTRMEKKIDGFMQEQKEKEKNNKKLLYGVVTAVITGLIGFVSTAVSFFVKLIK